MKEEKYLLGLYQNDALLNVLEADSLHLAYFLHDTWVRNNERKTYTHTELWELKDTWNKDDTLKAT